MARIVVAEDDADIRDLVVLKLRACGHDVVAVPDGVTALDACAVYSPDLVLLDVTMPGMDGIETCRSLRSSADFRDVPVVLLTARAQESDIERGLAAGADDYVVKPFSPRELAARVSSTLGRCSV